MSKLNADKLSTGNQTGFGLSRAMTMRAPGNRQFSLGDSGTAKQTYQLSGIEPIIEEEKNQLGNKEEQDFFGVDLPPPNKPLTMVPSRDDIIEADKKKAKKIKDVANKTTN